MARIRKVNPDARLIQTEDAGRTDSTPALADQAEFENHRRWLTFDFLAGRVSHAHPLWPWLLDCGASPADLHWFVDHPCTPDVIGLNYYLTSDRYLDEHAHAISALESRNKRTRTIRRCGSRTVFLATRQGTIGFSRKRGSDMAFRWR